MKAISIALLIAFGCVCSVQADVWVVRSKPQRNVWAVTNSSESPNSSSTPVVKPSLTTGSDDALDEVNAYRAKKGLPPFKHDPQLTIAAKRAAETRAKALWDGHLSNDFACLPAGATADAAGCGALEDSWGWGTCCMDDNYSHAGAAWVRGSDGKRYMHLFVRNGEAVAHTTKQKPEVARAEPTGEVVSMGTCSNGSCGVGAVQQSRFSRRRR
jgi:hypothetical protein